MTDATLSENQTYFVLDTISVHRKNILSLVQTMEANRKGIAKYLENNMEKAQTYYSALQEAHSNLIEQIRKLILCLLETGENELAAYSNDLASQLASFNLMTPDYSVLSGVIEGYADRLPANSTINASIIGRCMNSVRMGYYPTDLKNVELIMKSIVFPAGITTNLFDPCCGEGKALKKLAVGNNCYTFGVELDEGRAQIAQSELHRVGFGSFFYSKINHEAFHAVLLNPPYLSVITEGGSRARDEKRFLIETMPHLMMGGLLIYVIPYYRMTSDICRILCDNFDDISVYRFTEDEFKKFNQVAVLGTRIKKRNGSERARSLEELAYCTDKIPCVTDIEEARYTLPAQTKKVDVFKGAVFNKTELARQLKQSQSLDSLLTAKSLTKAVRQPPLPFTISQLGLVGGSGFINGLIECGYPHIIKGRIVKESRIETTENRNRDGMLMSVETKEKIINKMIFNVLTPEGYKALA